MAGTTRTARRKSSATTKTQPLAPRGFYRENHTAITPSSKFDTKPDASALRPFYEHLVAKYLPTELRW